MSVVPSSSSFTIEGPSVNYDITISNPESTDASTILVRAEIARGQTLKGAGGTDVLCFPNGASPGLLPPGNRTFTSSTSASNSAGGNGTLVAGSAVWRLTLYRFDSSSNSEDNARRARNLDHADRPVIVCAEPRGGPLRR